MERSTAWQAAGAGIAVQPNGIRVLRALGLGTAIENAGTVICHWDFCDQQGEVWGEVGPFLGIARTRLQQVLLSRAAAVPSRLGTSVTSLTQNEQHVSVGFSDGSRGVYGLVAKPCADPPARLDQVTVSAGRRLFLRTLPSGQRADVRFWKCDRAAHSR